MPCCGASPCRRMQSPPSYPPRHPPKPEPTADTAAPSNSSSRIHPRRQLKEVSAKAPLSALTHVKRVQRRDGDDGSLRVLLCECSDATPDGGAWPAPVRTWWTGSRSRPSRTRQPGRSAANQGPVGGVERAVAHRVAEAQQPPGGPFGGPVRYGRDGDEAMDAKLYRRREGGRGDERRPSSSTPPGRGRSSRGV